VLIFISLLYLFAEIVRGSSLLNIAVGYRWTYSDTNAIGRKTVGTMDIQPKILIVDDRPENLVAL